MTIARLKRWLRWGRPPSAPERGHFDPLYYRGANPDVAASGVDPFAHFMTHGWLEGRNPSRAFVTLFYRDRHLEGLRLNPLTHYAAHGAAAGLPTAPAGEMDYVLVQTPLARPYFSSTHYRSQRVGVEGDLLEHYLRIGWRDALVPSPSFDAQRYIALHPFVTALDVSPLYHFASQTRMAARTQAGDASPSSEPDAAEDAEANALIAAHFDRDFYLYENDDVRDAEVDPLVHFLSHGWRENRKPNPGFDCAYYLEQNPDVAKSGINPFYHYLAVGKAAGLRPNPFGHEPYPRPTAPSPDAWARAAPAVDAAQAECVVIMPVYKGHDETLAAIHAVLTARQRTRFALLVIDDGSPDAALSAALQALAARGLFLHARHATNLGFVATVNEGLRRFAGTDAILLNTDTTVFGDWLDRLVAHARRDPGIATVTPFSNNATIASYPLRNVDNAIQVETDAAGLDRLAASCNAGRASDIPVGVGFCLFVSARSRDIVGLLDEQTFGRGYGDENDFCIRASRAGLRNVLAEDVFVYHVGEVSFGVPQAKRRVRGQAELVAKHPHYPDLIRQHVDADATEPGRVRLDLKRLALASHGAEVHVFHALAGGIAVHVEHEAAKAKASGRAAILIRVGVESAWDLEIASASPRAPYCPNLRPLSIAKYRETLRDFLHWLAPSLLRVHSFAGLSWQATQALFALVRDSGVPYQVTLHDYAAFCHRNNLVQPNGRYCGLAPVETCRACIGFDRAYPEAVDPAERRDAYAAFLAGAARVIAPSEDVKARFARQGVRYAIDVVPHEDGAMIAPIHAPPQSPAIFKIVTIGAIGTHKGSRVIAGLARDARARDLPLEYSIVGYSDIGGEMAAAGVGETGRYASADEAFAHLVAAEPSAILLPSIWPETYCYTLSMALAFGCPPIVFDIGAQADRVRAAGVGLVLPCELIHDISAFNDRILEYVRQGGRP